MRWSERQQAMLREMGVPPFWPQTPAEPTTEVPAPQATEAASAPLVPTPAPTLVPPPSRRKVVTPPAEAAAPVAVPAAVPVVNAAGLDWAELQAAVQSCRACGLAEARTQAVFGVGHPQAQWMLVGEAPGEQEDRLGEPFVGRAGQLLDRMLLALGLTRAEAPAHQQVYIANVIKCRPPANRNPAPDEVQRCAPYLARQLALVQPRIVLAMGRFAAQTLLQTDAPIGRLRGTVHRLDSGVPVVVTYHPAYLLRNPADKALVWDDLCLAREVWAQSPM